MKYLLPLVGLTFVVLVPALMSAPENLVAEVFGAVPQITREEPEPSLDLEKALGQMMIIGFEGTEVSPELASVINEIQPGGVLLLQRNIVSKDQLTALIQDLQELSDVPLFVAVDQEGAALSRIPFASTPKDLKELGVTMNFAPVLDSTRQGDFLYDRSLRGDMSEAAALIRELEEQGVVAVPKHYPGYDGISFNPEIGIIPRVNSFPDASVFQELEEEVAFPAIMISHVVYENMDSEYPLPLSQTGIAAVTEGFGSDILIMSDDLSSKSMRSEFPVSGIGKDAVSAGVELLLVAGHPDPFVVQEFYQGFLNAAKQDPALRSKIREAANRILQIKGE